MPYQNEHACRLRNPDDFKDNSFRRYEQKSDGKKLDIIVGELKDTDKTEAQAMRYNKDLWTEEEARKHCKQHDGSFEPAKKEQSLSIFYNRPMLLATQEVRNMAIMTEIGMQQGIEPAIMDDTLLLKLSGILENRGDNCISIESFCSILSGLNNVIKRVILSFDSPGGSTDSIQEATAKIKEKRKQGIEFIAVANPLCCSGAYWIASACDKVFISSSTSRIGSIGVVTLHEDISKKDESEGRKVTEIIAGKYKRIDTEHKPLSPEGRAILQAQVDYVYTLFCNELAENRKIAIERVIGEIGDGRIFIGQQAVDLNLADGIMTLQSVLEREYMANNTPNSPISIQIAPPQQQQKAQEDGGEMERLKKENEDLKRMLEEMKQKMGQQEETTKATIDKEKKCAAESERERIRSLEELAPQSCNALLSQAKNEGWAVEKAAIEFLKAAKTINPLKSESVIVPPLLANKEDTQEALAKRIAESVNKNKIRS